MQLLSLRVSSFLGQLRLVEILERSSTATGSRRSTLEDGFEIVVMVFIETAIIEELQSTSGWDQLKFCP